MTTAIQTIESVNRRLMENAVLINVKLESVGKKRKINEALIEDMEADRKMIHLHKDIIDCPQLKSISLLDGQIRSYIRKNTYPTDFGNGVYILPLNMLEEVDDKLQAYQIERDELINSFCEVYEESKLNAKERLGKFYDETDYPPFDRVAEKFSFKIQCLAFEVPENIASVKKEIFDRESAKAEESWSKTYSMVQGALRSGMMDLTTHLIDRLTPAPDGKKKRFKEATVDNILEFLEKFEKRDITQDAKLKDLVQKAKFVMEGVNAETLRNDEATRKDVLVGFVEIRNNLDSMIESVPIRMIDFE
jgi:hypothetical protein